MDKFLGKYRVQSTRLRTWDYSRAGYYFITICTKDRGKYFGKISDGKIILNGWGEIAKKYGLEIPGHFDNEKIDVNVRANVGNGGNGETRHCLVSTKTNTKSNIITKSKTDKVIIHWPDLRSLTSVIFQFNLNNSQIEL